MSMNDPRELFIHELQDVYYAENALVKALPEMISEASDKELSKGLDKHLTETRQQVKNLEKVFRALGETAQGEKCPGIEGIKAEHDEFVSDEQPSPAVRDSFLTGAGAHTEHYEIAAYTGLVTMAKAFGEDECVRLLSRNLTQEQAALARLEGISERLAESAAQPATA